MAINIATGYQWQEDTYFTSHHNVVSKITIFGEPKTRLGVNQSRLKLSKFSFNSAEFQFVLSW